MKLTPYVSLFCLLLICSQAFSCVVPIYGNSAKAPKYWLDDGKPRGILVDIMKHLGEKLDCRFDIQLMPWKRAYLNALNGNGAVIGLSKTEDRLAIFDYSDVMFIDELLLVVRKGGEFKFEKLEDLKGKVVGTQRGSLYGSAFEKAVKTKLFQLSEDDSPISRFEKLLAGRLDVLIIGPGIQGFEAVINSSELLMKKRTELVILDTPLKRDPNYLGIAKSLNQKAFVKKFDMALNKAKKEGVIDEIIAKYSVGN